MKKILVVDDEKDIRELLQKRIVRSGYEAQAAADGKIAFEMCKATKFDLVIMDIAMPMMDGYQTCAQLKGNTATKDIPVLLLTSKDLEPKAIAQHYDELGVAGYLAKPSSFEELLKKIKEVIDEDKGKR